MGKELFDFDADFCFLKSLRLAVTDVTLKNLLFIYFGILTIALFITLQVLKKNDDA